MEKKNLKDNFSGWGWLFLFFLFWLWGVMVGLVHHLLSMFWSLRTLGICCCFFVLFSWWSLYYVKGFCALKMLPLLVSVSVPCLGFFFWFYFWWDNTQDHCTLQPWRGFGHEACLSESNVSLKVSAVPQALSLSQLLCCVTMLIGPSNVNLTKPTQPRLLPLTSCKKRLWICVS